MLDASSCCLGIEDHLEAKVRRDAVFLTYFFRYEFANRTGLIKTRNYIQYSVPSPINVVENNFCE